MKITRRFISIILAIVMLGSVFTELTAVVAATCNPHDDVAINQGGKGHKHTCIKCNREENKIQQHTMTSKEENRIYYNGKYVGYLAYCTEKGCYYLIGKLEKSVYQYMGITVAQACQASKELAKIIFEKSPPTGIEKKYTDYLKKNKEPTAYFVMNEQDLAKEIFYHLYAYVNYLIRIGSGDGVDFGSKKDGLSLSYDILWTKAIIAYNNDGTMTLQELFLQDTMVYLNHRIIAAHATMHGPGSSGGGGGSTVLDPIAWPDPLGDPDPQDFYLVPQSGKNPNTSDGKWALTYGAWNGAQAYKSQPWIDNLVDTGSKATFDILPNDTNTARDGSVRAVLGDYLVECIRYLECSPVQTYDATIPAYGGSVTITLPNGYQYYQYGTLDCSSKPDWIDTPYFSQTASSAAPTITIGADYTSAARNGTIVVTMGNTRDGTYEIAKINVSQSAISGSVTAAQMVTRAATTDFVLVPAAGGKDYEISHAAYTNATMEYSGGWFINLRNTSSKATFDIAGNPDTEARDGSVKTLSNGTVVQQIRYLQCGQQKEYIYDAVNPNGETINITLPYGYQYIEYGMLTCGSRPDWITSVSFTQNATVMPAADNYATVKITVDKADISRSGKFTLRMGNTSTSQGNQNTSYAIATVTITQSVTAPANISVSPSLLSIETGENYGLKAILTPSYVQNQIATWSSSNTGVATVSKNGEVTGVSPGTANITVRTVNGLTAVCEVTVTEPYTPVEVETDHLQFNAAASAGTDAWVLSVENGGDYTVISDEWLHCDINGSELRVTSDENTGDENRYGAITIEAENGSSTMLTVKQVGTSFELSEKEPLLEALLEAAGSEIDLDQTDLRSYERLVYAFYAGIMAYEDTYVEQDVTDAITEDIYDALDDVTITDNTIPIELETVNHFAYVIGYDDSTVRPENDITRAETAAIVFRLLTDKARSNYWSNSNIFNDVDSGRWYNNAVSTMTNAGIIKGYPDSTFRGDKYINRAEFAAILARFNSDTYTGANKFTDVDGHWAAEYINRAAEKGWVNGYTGDDAGKFKPDQNITRAEAMTVLNRVLGRTSIDKMHGDMTTWTDNSNTKWYYRAVQEATNSHEYERDANGFEYWTKVVPAPDWANLEKSWSPITDDNI